MVTSTFEAKLVDVSCERNFSSDKERGETAVFECGTETFSQNLSQNLRVESLSTSTTHAPVQLFMPLSQSSAAFRTKSHISEFISRQKLFLFLYKR